MPYITPEQRAKLDQEIEALSDKLLENAEVREYNYAITKLIHGYIKKKGVRYRHLNAAKGILNDAKDEFNRTVMTPYENEKRSENGSVSDLDK